MVVGTALGDMALCLEASVDQKKHGGVVCVAP
jgi:hypothetical protein